MKPPYRASHEGWLAGCIHPEARHPLSLILLAAHTPTIPRYRLKYLALGLVVGANALLQLYRRHVTLIERANLMWILRVDPVIFSSNRIKS